MDVTSHSLSVATAGGIADVLVNKNAQIPIESTRVFTTAHDDQTDVVIRVGQGESRKFSEINALGELRLEGLRKAKRGELEIEVSFILDVDGILQVSARDLASGVAERATLRVLGVGQRR
jgi:molecular chaperone DnaK